jgi:hypothetical protein
VEAENLELNFSGGRFVVNKATVIGGAFENLHLPFTVKGGFIDVKLHPKRVGKMSNYARNEWGRCKNTLGTSGEDVRPC